MDSLTQITLGAACGELVLGRKIGNRALLWGAVGGTIPDLDVAANLFTDPITAMAMHRGITHSIFFAVTFPILFGWLIHKFYESGFYKKKGYKAGIISFWVLLLLLFSFSVAFQTSGNTSNLVLMWMGGIAILIGWFSYRFYFRKEQSDVHTTWWDWIQLFFWSIFTHPLLDCCTAYGTQLYQPFSNYRVAWDNISVVDPIYTIPFLICLIIAGMLLRTSKKRRFLVWLGVGLSCAYLVYTAYNKWQVNQVFKNSLAEREIKYDRYVTVPTILNSILWQGIAEGDSVFYHGFYSVLDEEPRILKINEFPKNHNLLDGHQEDRDVKILKWFTNDYYNVYDRGNGRLQFNNLRYGIFRDEFTGPSDYVFKFMLEENEAGTLIGKPHRDPSEIKREDLRKFWERLKGIRD
jgi:inner membrane protein